MNGERDHPTAALPAQPSAHRSSRRLRTGSGAAASARLAMDPYHRVGIVFSGSQLLQDPPILQSLYLRDVPAKNVSPDGASPRAAPGWRATAQAPLRARGEQSKLAQVLKRRWTRTGWWRDTSSCSSSG